MTAWSEDDWHDAWVMLTGQWPTLRREGAEAGYRHALTRFTIDEVATMILRFVESSDDEPKAAVIADALRSARAEATRREERAAAHSEKDDQRHAPASIGAAWKITEQRHERGQSIGLAQWIALGCPATNPNIRDLADGMLERVARLVTEDGAPRVAVRPDGRAGSRPVVGIGSVGPAIRGALRVAHEHDRALALRRLAGVMHADDHALLVDEVTP